MPDNPRKKKTNRKRENHQPSREASMRQRETRERGRAMMEIGPRSSRRAEEEEAIWGLFV